MPAGRFPARQEFCGLIPNAAQDPQFVLLAIPPQPELINSMKVSQVLLVVMVTIPAAGLTYRTIS